MSTSTKGNQHLRQLARYKSLRTTRIYLLTMLLLLSLYVGYQGYTMTPLYLSVLLVLLPSMLLMAFQGTQETKKAASYTEYNLGYSNQKHRMILITYCILLLLLLIWTISYHRNPPHELWLKVSPAILIISSLFIYTIGQYYYFHAFHHYLQNNQIDAIH